MLRTLYVAAAVVAVMGANHLRSMFSLVDAAAEDRQAAVAKVLAECECGLTPEEIFSPSRHTDSPTPTVSRAAE